MPIPRLMAPGPTPLPQEVLQALALPIIHHRTPQYKAILIEVLEGLKLAFQARQPVLQFPSTGTGAMEGTVVNLMNPGDTMLVAGAGKFTERWRDIGKTYGVNVLFPEMEYGKAVYAVQVEEQLKAHPEIKAVFTQLSETSTGTLNDIEGIAKVVSKTPALLVVDAISGLLGDKLLMDEWGIDVVVSGSQKGFMLPPGLAFAALSERAWATVEGCKQPRYYFNFKKMRKSLFEESADPFTGAVNLMFGLQASLKLIKSQGMERIWERHRLLAEATRGAVKALGLEFFSERPTNVVTAVKVPAGVDGGKIPSRMRDVYGITIAGGQGSMKGQIFRLAHLGYMGRMDILTGLTALEMTLTDLGYGLEMGKGVGAAAAILREAPLSELP